MKVLSPADFGAGKKVKKVKQNDIICLSRLLYFNYNVGGIHE